MLLLSLFFFNDTATTEIYTLSLHDALPILDAIRDKTELVPDVRQPEVRVVLSQEQTVFGPGGEHPIGLDRKSTRLNSSHGYISYAVFCLKKKRSFDSAPRECVSLGHNTRPH